MTHIDPTILRAQRKKLRMSMADLAQRSGVNKTTIARIERGEMTSNRRYTVARLCAHLKLNADQLAGLVPLEVAPSVTPEQAKGQLNARVSNGTRNALALVAKRYQVSAGHIIEFAPLLFHMMASESLCHRRRNLAQLRQARDAVSALESSFGHLSGRLVDDYTADEIDRLEERSINGKDIVGRTLVDGDHAEDPLAWDYIHEDQNPFVAFLRNRLGSAQPFTDSSDTLDGWSGWRSPSYSICREEALTYFDGDEDAADALLNGVFAITELPKDLREAEDPAARTAWARSKAEAAGIAAQEAMARLEERLASLKIQL
ncbi:helix-turn-helix transcriptional regulator [Altererythrobacter sp. TH136]|uniref:helix-turn-helix domain-containing protein n=1 Tax=Altererythrobacter sp. TH136 TaxID=2067415 RepID=UPI001165510D|nr:helix-turn-helix transcriptional regulator [Altererythrobacter sp. TH136]QDM40811.1 helix-turn-helix transcriptional regulator [Altererythrobacter sp. TH136]